MSVAPPSILATSHSRRDVLTIPAYTPPGVPEVAVRLEGAPIEGAPAGIEPIYHPDGWVGLSEGEGQDATRAWWVRSAGQSPGQIRIEVLDAGWDD